MSRRAAKRDWSDYPRVTLTSAPSYSIESLTRSPSRILAVAASSLGIRTARLLPHFANCVLIGICREYTARAGFRRPGRAILGRRNDRQDCLFYPYRSSVLKK